MKTKNIKFGRFYIEQIRRTSPNTWEGVRDVAGAQETGRRMMPVYFRRTPVGVQVQAATSGQWERLPDDLAVSLLDMASPRPYHRCPACGHRW